MKFDSPETPAQAKARTQAEEAKRVRAQSLAKLKDRAAQPLRGDSSNVGQGQLFEADLFSGPSHEAYTRALQAHKPDDSLTNET